MTVEPVAPIPATSHRRAEMIASASAKGLSLDTAIPDKKTLVLGEAIGLRRLFVILLDNAIKYTESGSIQLSLSSDERLASVTITDTRIGIESAALPHIFDRFWRADKVRSRAEGGAGLGLSLAKQIVQQHGGEISVESEIDRDTSFRVQLQAPGDGEDS